MVLKSFFYEKGELHGDAKFYNPKGELVSEGQYKRGKKDGLWKYYEKGDLIDGLFDLRSLGSSFEGSSSLMYLINGSMKGVDGYIKRLIDETRLAG